MDEKANGIFACPPDGQQLDCPLVDSEHGRLSTVAKGAAEQERSARQIDLLFEADFSFAAVANLIPHTA